MAGALLFFGLQILAPIIGTLLGYGYCYRQRLQGVSGQKLEAILIQWSFLIAAGLSFLFFWLWPEGSQGWYEMPGFAWICGKILISPPQSDSSYVLVKLFVAVLLAFFCGLLARMHSFSLTRRLVREVSRFYRPEESVGKR